MNCKKCNEPFKVKQWIDGKLRNLSSRKYCLDCSPFKSHNTKDLTRKTTPNNRKKVTEWRRRTKLKLIEHKGGKCEQCGYDKPIPSAYDFHHRDPNEKDFSLSGCSLSYDRQLQEVNKCILLCCRCHAELHYEEYCGC